MKQQHNMKFVIVGPIRQLYGGNIVLNALCKYLTEEGYNARMFTPFNLSAAPLSNATLFQRIKRKLKYVKYVYLYAKDMIKIAIVKVVDVITHGGACKTFILQRIC